MNARLASRRGVVNGFIALYGLYCSNYILALITVPYLVRALGKSNWGILAFTQAFCNYLLIIIELGFPYSATRSAARQRDSHGVVSELLASVLTAKFWLGVLCAGAALVAQYFVPAFQQDKRLLWWGVVWAVMQGMNVYWLYQAMENARMAVTIDLSFKALGVAAIFWVVRTPDDAWKVLALQAVSSFASLAVLLRLAYRVLPFRLPRWKGAWEVLRPAFVNFGPRNATAFYTMGNAFILGLFVAPEIVGAYAGADRISRAMIGLLGPASDAVFPRISHMATQSRSAVRHWARVALVLIGGAGVVLGIAIYVLAPQMVRILLGPGYADAVVVLRIFSVLPPIVAIRNVLGVHWMMALDLDKIFSQVVLITGLINIPLSVILASTSGAVGVAWAGVGAQAVATFGTYAALRWMRMDPIGRSMPELQVARAAGDK